MQLAKAWLIIDKRGSNVPIRGLTPAELVLLCTTWTDFIGKHPVHDLVITGDSQRSDALEKQRLTEKHGGSIKNRKIPKVEALYPGHGSKLPQTFEELGRIFKDSQAKELKEPLPNIPDFEDSDLAKLDREVLESEAAAEPTES